MSMPAISWILLMYWKQGEKPCTRMGNRDEKGEKGCGRWPSASLYWFVPLLYHWPNKWEKWIFKMHVKRCGLEQQVRGLNYWALHIVWGHHCMIWPRKYVTPGVAPLPKGLVNELKSGRELTVQRNGGETVRGDRGKVLSHRALKY
jgi:hypothetical protein